VNHANRPGNRQVVNLDLLAGGETDPPAAEVAGETSNAAELLKGRDPGSAKDPEHVVSAGSLLLDPGGNAKGLQLLGGRSPPRTRTPSGAPVGRCSFPRLPDRHTALSAEGTNRAGHQGTFARMPPVSSGENPGTLLCSSVHWVRDRAGPAEGAADLAAATPAGQSLRTCQPGRQSESTASAPGRSWTRGARQCRLPAGIVRRACSRWLAWAGWSMLRPANGFAQRKLTEVDNWRLATYTVLHVQPTTQH
jgi:hypothetical protein